MYGIICEERMVRWKTSKSYMNLIIEYIIWAVTDKSLIFIDKVLKICLLNHCVISSSVFRINISNRLIINYYVISLMAVTGFRDGLLVT